MTNYFLFVTIAVAGFVSFAAVRIWRPFLAKSGALDVPNHRSSHVQPTLRGGGIGPLTAQIVVVALTFFLADWRPLLEPFLVASCFGILIGLVGFYEDVKGLRSIIRAGLQISLGFIFILISVLNFEFHWIWLPLGALVIAANVNFVNFMDGVNGISGLFALVFGISYVVTGYFNESNVLVLGGGMIAASFGVFLFWNFYPPGLFLGDVGSYLLGGTTIFLFLTGVWSGIDPLVLFAPLSIYWLDTITTLFLRVIRREKIFEAHRSHTYQKLSQLGLSHLGVAALVAVFSCFMFALAIAGEIWPTLIQWPLVVAMIFVGVGYLFLPKLISTRKKEP